MTKIYDKWSTVFLNKERIYNPDSSLSISKMGRQQYGQPNCLSCYTQEFENSIFIKPPKQYDFHPNIWMLWGVPLKKADLLKQRYIRLWVTLPLSFPGNLMSCLWLRYSECKDDKSWISICSPNFLLNPRKKGNEKMLFILKSPFIAKSFFSFHVILNAIFLFGLFNLINVYFFTLLPGRTGKFFHSVLFHYLFYFCNSINKCFPEITLAKSSK